MINYIRLNYPEDFNDWIESSEFVALVDLLAYLGQSLAFRMDLNTRENFLDTATRRESIFRLARMLNYQPQRCIPLPIQQSPKLIPQPIPQQISKHKKEEKKTKYKKKAIPKTVKKATWDRWIGKDVGVTKCLCCEHQEIRQFEFHCGHVVAESKGGKTTVDNMRPICAQCNLSMGSMDMNEFKKMYFEKTI